MRALKFLLHTGNTHGGWYRGSHVRVGEGALSFAGLSTRHVEETYYNPDRPASLLASKPSMVPANLRSGPFLQPATSDLSPRFPTGYGIHNFTPLGLNPSVFI